MSSSDFFRDVLKVSRRTVTEEALVHYKGWLLVHDDAGKDLAGYSVTGNATNCGAQICAAVVIDILVAKRRPTGVGDLYLPNVGGYWSGHRGPVIDPSKARSIHRYVKDIPHHGVWSLDVPMIKHILGSTLVNDEVVVCYVHAWTSTNQALRLWVDAMLYYE